jgi:lysozyme
MESIMRTTLIFWIIIFAFGVLVGERYGLPGWATSLTDRGFQTVEGLLGNVNEPIPAAENDGAEPEAVEAETEAEVGPAPQTSPPASNSQGGADDNANLRINDAGLQIIKDSEGLRLEAYNAGGKWYIGYGHARTARSGMKITEAQAEALLREDVKDAEDGVRKAVTVPVNRNQFSAMVSLAYNLGVGGFGHSTVLAAVNAGDYEGAADAFLNHNKAGGKVLEHLTMRREKERALFLQ